MVNRSIESIFHAYLLSTACRPIVIRDVGVPFSIESLGRTRSIVQSLIYGGLLGALRAA